MNAQEILTEVLEEYPKNPARMALFEPRFAREAPCMCLLGRIGFVGGANRFDLARNVYSVLYDGNGMETAILLLASVIAPHRKDYLLDPRVNQSDRVSEAERIVYNFNDNTLDYKDGGSLTGPFTPESIEIVTQKIREALALSKELGV